MAGEKTEKATPKRKQDERKKGNIFQSREVVAVFSLLVIFYAFKFLAPYTIGILQRSITSHLQIAADLEFLTVDQVRMGFINSCLIFVVAAMPMLLIGAMAAILLTGAQTRFLFSTKLLAFKGNRINPIQGFKRMFSMHGLVELVKAIVKIIVLGIIIYQILREQLPLFTRMMDFSVAQAMVQTGDVIFSIVQTAVIFFVFLAVVDYAYQWWEYEKNLRMSKQDIKEEYKETEGDPQIKGKIKERQQQQARQRMMQQVPTADVIIRNPTHYAVALRYDAEKQNAPIVVAKGADRVALKIVEIAEANHITIMENKPLARGLYDAVDLDQEIPEEFFRPVAEVLAYVYSLKGRE